MMGNSVDAFDDHPAEEPTEAATIIEEPESKVARAAAREDDGFCQRRMT
jgi:hypothetical protein